MNKHKRLSKILKNNIGLLFLVIILSGCTEKEEFKEYAAKVDDEILTDDEINQYLDLERYGNLHKSEFVYNWIEKELLYKEALQSEIDQDTNTIRLIDDLKKELLASIVLNKYVEANSVVPTKSEIEDYFEKYKDNFIIQDDAYVLNKITFDNKDKAVLFRNTLSASNWQKAVAVFAGDSSIIEDQRSLLIYQYQLTPIKLARVVKNLRPNEYSIIFEIEHDNYSVVQLDAKLKKGSVPELEEIEELVTKRYLILQRNQIIKKYIFDLYKKYNVEIKR